MQPLCEVLQEAPDGSGELTSPRNPFANPDMREPESLVIPQSPCIYGVILGLHWSYVMWR